MCIKSTHIIYKAGIEYKYLQLLENRKEGIRLLMAGGIDIARMEEADWNFLYDLVDINDDQRRLISPYTESRREALDMETYRILGLQSRNCGSNGSSSQGPGGGGECGSGGNSGSGGDSGSRGSSSQGPGSDNRGVGTKSSGKFGGCRETGPKTEDHVGKKRKRRIKRKQQTVKLQ